MPLFVELQPYLEDAWEISDGIASEYVITRYRGNGKNFRTKLTKIIKRAGFDCWPRLFQNLRASRETELESRYGIRAAADWLGNSPKVALDHYIGVSSVDFQHASGRAMPEGGAGGGAGVVGTRGNRGEPAPTLTLKNKGYLENSLVPRTPGIGLEGLEPPTKGL